MMDEVVVVGHSRSASGAERVLLRYVTALLARGCPVRAVCPEGALGDALGGEGVTTVTIPELQLPTGPRPLAAGRLVGRWLRAAMTIRRALGPGRLVVVNGLLALPAVVLGARSSTVVWLVHDVVVRRDLRFVASRSAPRVAAAIAVSEAAGRYPRQLGIPTTVVRNGTTWPIEAAPLDHPGRPIVGINATVTPWKGHDVLLEAVAGIPEVDVEILGGRFPKDGPYLRSLQRRAEADDLRGRVRFLGHVDRPLDRMRSWTVAVSSSVEPEAGPLAVLEAMSLGIPVVATSHGGALEVVGEAGLLVEPGDPGQLSEALSRLVTDRDLRRRCSEAGRVAVAASLTEEASADAFLAALGAVGGTRNRT